MLPIRPSAILLAASLTAGCTVGSDYVRPDAALPLRYHNQAAVEQRDAHAEAALDTWWKGFADDQLTAFVGLALERNLDLAQAAARVAQARAGLAMAGAALLPSGSVGGQAARAYQSLDTPLGQVLNAAPGFDRHGTAYEANLGVAWELDLFGGLRRGQEAASADYQASEAGAAALRLAVAAQAADIYISVRGLQARLGIARNQVKTQQELLDTVRLLHGKGLAAELRVRQAEAALAEVRSRVPVLEAGLEAASNALDVLLASPPGTHRAQLADARVIPVAPRIDASGTPGDLLRRRPDLIVAERRLAAANARIGSAIAEFYPKLSLSGLIGSATAVSSGKLFSSDAGQAAGVLGLRWRLFDFGRINAQIALAKGVEAEMLAAYRLAALRATEDVENAFSSLVRNEEQAGLLAQSEESSGRAREASFAAYQNGVVSLIEVLQADEQLLRVADAQAQARTRSAHAAVAAFKALGGGWQTPAAESVAIR